MIDDNGKLLPKVQVSRLIAHGKQQQLSNALRKLSYELKLLITGKLKPQDVTSTTISYHMQTEDDYLHNDWFMNQSFGFHGAINNSDSNFLEKFYGEESRKFLPIAGVATKLNSSNMIVAHAYSFLPLPIQTGLPVHVNGHFAIHSSRRSIWEHTSFGQWNRLLRDHIIAPSYCHFLLDLGKTFRTPPEVKQWIRFLPEVSKAKDEFFAALIGRVYAYVIEAQLPLIPVPQGNVLTFKKPSTCLFATTVRNPCVESILLKLSQNVCTVPEVGIRFKMASVTSLNFINATVVLDCLKKADLGLPKQIKDTPFTDHPTLSQMLSFILGGATSTDYCALVDSPLCLTSDNDLRLFSSQSPVYVDSGFNQLCPKCSHLFIHQDCSVNFSATKILLNSPIQSLSFKDVGRLLPELAPHMDKAWTKLMWTFIKV